MEEPATARPRPARRTEHLPGRLRVYPGPGVPKPRLGAGVEEGKQLLTWRLILGLLWGQRVGWRWRSWPSWAALCATSVSPRPAVSCCL